MRNRFLSCLVGWLGLVHVGCSSSSNDEGSAASAGGSTSSGGSSGGGASGGASGNVDSAEGFCKGLIETTVEVATRCQGGPPDAWRLLLDSPYECAHVEEAASNGRLAFSSADAAACLSAASGASCEVQGTSSDAPTGACRTALGAKVPLGGKCRSFQVFSTLMECEGEAFCADAVDTCAGVCTAYQKDADSCDPLALKRCAPGSSCLSKRCVPDLAEGDACPAPGGASCAKGLFCQLGTPPAAGTCSVRKTAGACVNLQDCEPDYYCDASHQCSRRIATGAPCTVGAAECARPGYCKDGTCAAALPKLGEACGRIAGETALCGGGYCDGAGTAPGVCRAKKEPGEACTGAGLGICDGDHGHCDQATLKCVACDAR